MLTVICFSKDRPWQLQELIRSVLHFWIGTYDYYILYTTSSSKFQNAYNILIEEMKIYPHIHFILENNFCTDLSSLISSSSSSNICFHVDDMLFYRSFNISSVLKFFNDSNNRLIAFFIKLNNNINYSHPSSSSAATPVFTIKSGYPSYNVWMPSFASSDWNYLWDLCGTIYLKKDIQILFNAIINKFGVDGVKSPNKFEVNGNKLIYAIYPGNQMKMFAGCMQKSIMSVITINRVQNDYNVPIYNNYSKDIHQLLDYFINERELNWNKYTKQIFNSVHIPYLYLFPKKNILIKNRKIKQIDDVDDEKEYDLNNYDQDDIDDWTDWLLKQTKHQNKHSKQD